MDRPEERSPTGKRKSRLEDYTEMDLSLVRRSVDGTDQDQFRNRWRAFVNMEIDLPIL